MSLEILPFTPANRNNLIGWIAGRSDGAQYGTSVVYNFPKTKLVDGPLQIEARIDQNAQLSGQLTLWNQQGSHVRRGALLDSAIAGAEVYRTLSAHRGGHGPLAWVVENSLPGKRPKNFVLGCTTNDFLGFPGRFRFPFFALF